MVFLITFPLLGLCLDLILWTCHFIGPDSFCYCLLPPFWTFCFCPFLPCVLLSPSVSGEISSIFLPCQHAKISASPKCVLPVWRKPPSECSTSVNAWKNDSPTQNISQSTYKRERFRLKVCGVSLNLNQLDWACDLKEVKSLCDVPSTGRSSVPCWGAGSKCCVFQIGSNKHFSLSVWSVFLLFDLDC